MSVVKKTLLILLACAAVLFVAVSFLAYKPVPEDITYGISFNTLYAEELGLNPRVVYDAFLDDLGVRHLRLAAHWDMVEPEDGLYDFSALDYQLKRAEEVGAEVILGVGRRLPRWPECHEPIWAKLLPREEQDGELLEYIETVVTRYKGNPSIAYWQVENEPYLSLFGGEHCDELDEDFLREEIALVRSLDNTRPIILTDSGNLGTWFGAYKEGDVFGTSVYVYFWTPELGQFKTILPAWFYRLKEGVVELFYGKKQTFLIELSAEPWLTNPVVETDIETQYTRMNPKKFEEIIEYAKDTRYSRQYLWGGEWWFWLREQGRPEMWERGRALYVK